MATSTHIGKVELSSRVPPRESIRISSRGFLVKGQSRPARTRRAIDSSRVPRMHMCKTIRLPGLVRQGCRATAQVELELGQDVINHDVDMMPEIAKDQASFSWTKQWYPVAIVEDLEASKPTPVKLFGKSLVLWRDADKQWKCFADTCPHRLAPLSEGRIEADGTLQCSYHGWRFDSEGACTSVPQAESPQQEHNAAAHPRACATVYPSQVQHQLVWVWPEAGPNAHLEAMSREATVIPELLDENIAAYAVPWFMRELPYGYDVLIENLLDPAHVPWAHHGVSGGGDRYSVPLSTLDKPHLFKDTHGFETVFKQDISGNTNSSTQLQAMSKSQDATMIFKAPGLVNYKYGGPEGVQIVSYSTPATPGNCRVLFCVVMDRRTAPKKTIQFLDLRPVWLKFVDHYERNEVLDGDNCFLHMQDIKLHGEEADSHYYMPTSMDRAVATFRRWMHDTAGPLPWAVPVGPETWAKASSRREMLDRYNQHTKHCKNCSKALQVFTAAQRVAVGGLAVAALSGAAAVGAGQTPPTTWLGIAAGALLSAVVVWQLEAQRSKFLFIDYVHSEH